MRETDSERSEGVNERQKCISTDRLRRGWLKSFGGGGDLG